MGINTTYVCDRCGTERPTPEQMWVVGIVARRYKYSPSNTPVSPRNEGLWCRECCDEVQLILFKPNKEAPEPELSLNERLVETLKAFVAQEVGE